MTQTSCLIIRLRESMAASCVVRLMAVFAGVAVVPVSAQELGSRPETARTFSVQAAVAEVPEGGSSSRGAVRRDDQVVPAGAHFMHGHQQACPPGGCGLGAKCPGTCVVRPSRFGFYATQWRKWPGDDGVQQASLQEMTPVSPPASAIPSVEEEALMPSSLMPDDDDTGFGSDNFGFEEVVPTPATPSFPPAEMQEESGRLPGSGLPDATEDEAIPPKSGKPSLFDEDAPPQKPSLFDEPAVSPAEPSPRATPAEEKKPDESIDNLFDEFGRASQLNKGGLRQSVAVAQQQVTGRQSQQNAGGRNASDWLPREIAGPTTTRPLSREGFLSRSADVVPASAVEQTTVRSNPLR